MEPVEEIEKRIKRLEAEIELAESRLEFMDRVGASSRYAIWERREEPLDYYMVFFFVVLLLSLAVFWWVRAKVGVSYVSLRPYIATAAVLGILPVAYFIMRARGRRKDANPVEYLGRRESAARTVLREFYIPLRKAVEEDDREGIRALADKLITDAALAGDFELLNEGDAKLTAYALYLYAVGSTEQAGEMVELLERAPNRAVKSLLIKALEEVGIHEVPGEEQGDHEGAE
ncbi:hypothetical protein [Palaeococcus ferrophilus]|uniref:hypothetical protein n=1 Tax=Palaeococcus ferrophilus TaxID=83868 RepID=UPI00064E414B|nr:hypothetical protein [Palaeococcus ferrophilus]